MAIPSTIGPKNVVNRDQDEWEKKHLSELSDALLSEANRLRKKKKSSHEDDAASAMAGPLVPNQDKKLQLGEGAEKSTQRTASVKSQESMTLDAIATAMREAGISKKVSADAKTLAQKLEAQQVEKPASDPVSTKSNEAITAERKAEKATKDSVAELPTTANLQQRTGNSTPQEAQHREAVKQDVASQATVQALRDKNTTTGTETTYTFQTWGGDKSVVISSAQQAGALPQFDLRTSDAHVKQILDRRLNREDAKIDGIIGSNKSGDGIGSSIRSVESSADKQSNERRSRGNPDKSNEDA